MSTNITAHIFPYIHYSFYNFFSILGLHGLRNVEEQLDQEKPALDDGVVDGSLLAVNKYLRVPG
ncbi:hypothetical protein [Halobacillus sp. K22]|uniref:hypothetical protein n=1 Tax=Halobacillus sp. K22 TaxID=3457431 RepID=UPI003FCD8F3A